METTLGLSFSTRMLGLAVFKSNHLVDYSIKLHKQMWSPQKRDLILSSLASCIIQYAITDIALSIPDGHCQTADFKEMHSAIEMLAHVHGISVTAYPATELYRNFGSPVRRTRNNLMKRLSLLYPELERYYEKERRNKHKYYIKLFEAVAAGAYHWLERNSK